MRFVQLVFGDAAAGRTDADGRQIGLHREGLLEEGGRFARPPDLLHLRRQAGQQRVAIGILLQGQIAKLFRLVVEVKGREPPVKLQGRLGRRLCLVALDRVRDALPLRLLERLLVHNPMPPAPRTYR